MDKNKLNSVSKKLKKEGFYLVLFVCLCIIATVAVVKTRSKVDTSKPPVASKPVETSDDTSFNTDGLNTEKSEINNAKQVNKESNAITVPKETKDTAAVSSTVNTVFAKPVEGKVARQYSETPVAVDASGTKWSTHLGIDIQVAKGTPVAAVLDGVVEEVGFDSDGEYVKINHQNGLKTVYGNLEETVNVKVNQKVTKGEVIGKVGDTTLNGKYEQPVCDFLSFKVLKGNDTIDPAKYVKYDPVK